MHIHILGICGTFMGGLALLARAAGHRVTGCDSNVYPPMSTQLEQAGIGLVEGFAADQIGLAADLWVVGNVVTRGNPLMEEILDRGLPYTSGPQWVGEHLLRERWVLAVAGTHGKTSTASMLAWILEANGLNPGFLIGGVPLDFGVSARLADSRHFVIEADEYDTAFFDKRSKFVHYHSRTAVLNNLEYDHADIFADLGAIETQFHHLVRTLPRTGLVVVPRGDAALERVLARGLWTPLVRVGPGGDWSFDTDEPTLICHGTRAVGPLVWDLWGEHNRANALAALAAAHHVGIAPERALAALASFKGVKRRMELVGTARGVAVYDDFAHHPTAIATTLAGLRQRRRDSAQAGRVIAVLEPRSNTMKLGVMKAALPGSLAAADLVFGYGASEGPGRLGWDLAAVLAPLGQKARAFDDIDALVAALAATAEAGDAIVVMSNGGFGGVHQRLLSALGERKEAT